MAATVMAEPPRRPCTAMQGTGRSCISACLDYSATDGTATLMYSEPLPSPRTLQINDVFVVDSQALTGDFTLQLL